MTQRFPCRGPRPSIVGECSGLRDRCSCFCSVARAQRRDSHLKCGKGFGVCTYQNRIWILSAAYYGGNCRWGFGWNDWGGKLSLLDGKVEDHAHVLKNCYFSAFMFDMVRKAFGLVSWEGATLEPSRLLLDHAAVSLQTTQGLTLWAALKAQWQLRCAKKYQHQHQQATLHEFVAVWAGILER